MPRDRRKKQPSAEFEEDRASGDVSREYLKKQLARFKEYTSFTTLDDDGQRRRYNLYTSRTATGLLRDVIATTRRLNAAEKRAKAFTEEAFAAYCMHICATKCAKWVRLDDVMSDVYKEIREWLKENLEKGGMTSFHSFLATRATWRYRDILRKGRITITETDEETGKKKTTRASRNVSLENGEDGGGNGDADPKLNLEVLEEILAQGAEAMVLESDRADVNRAIEVCLERRELTEEQVVILCHAYGLGDSYALLSQTEIAKKLHRSDAHVSRQLAKAIEVLRGSGMLPPLHPGVSLK